jgi:hypothetical protein
MLSLQWRLRDMPQAQSRAARQTTLRAPGN